MSNNVLYKKINKTRTDLLLSVNEEYNKWRKTMTTKINSRTLIENEKKYSEICIKLKEVKFAPNHITGTGVSHQEKGRISTINCANNNNKINISFNQNEITNTNLPLSLVKANRMNISNRKNDYFRRNTLKTSLQIIDLKNITRKSFIKDVNTLEANLEYINVDSGFIRNEKTLQRTIKGFNFLQSLSLKYKKSNEEKHDFDEWKKILCIKENIDENSLTTSRTSFSPRVIINQFEDEVNNIEIESFSYRATNNTKPKNNLLSANYITNYKKNDKKDKKLLNLGNLSTTFGSKVNTKFSSNSTIPKDELNFRLDTDINLNSLEVNSSCEYEKLNHSYHCIQKSKDFFIKLHNCSYYDEKENRNRLKSKELQIELLKVNNSSGSDTD